MAPPASATERLTDEDECRVASQSEQLRTCAGDYGQFSAARVQRWLAWWEANHLRLDLRGPLPRQAYTLVLLLYMGLDPHTVPVVYEDDKTIIWRSTNFCPTLEACRRLGLDTRIVCRAATEAAVQALIARLDPRLRFSRNYADGLRPYADYCEEQITLLDDFRDDTDRKHNARPLSDFTMRNSAAMMDTLRADAGIAMPLKEFLLTEQLCPPEWRPYDLYLCRDEEIVFYVGQSYTAFDRVWQHILDGFKGRSVLGRFILCNWPAALRFTIELQSSRSVGFIEAGHDLNAAERTLIERHAPCFNEILNRRPAPLPARYAPPGSTIRCSRSLGKLIGEARHAVQADRRKGWLADLAAESPIEGSA